MANLPSYAGNDVPKHHVNWSESLIQRYDQPGPRYTSYPSALSFADLSEAERRVVMDCSTPGAPLSLYVHIPFCRHLCYYCACNKVVTRDTGKADSYLTALEEEARYLSQWCGERPVTQLHWGGGTPTFLTDEQTDRLGALLHRHFRLESQSRKREFSIEIDPRVVSRERLQKLAKLGFNRVSLGVQDFNEATQRAVHRVQPFELVRDVVASARETGYQSINFDLIYGLPHQTIESFDQTIDQVLLLQPDRIACYNYAHLPSRFSPQRRIVSSELPTPATKLVIFQHVIDRLQAAGYLYIGLDHFARPSDALAVAWREGSVQRNFQGYSTHAETELLGLGVSAISHVSDMYWQNEKQLAGYERLADTGKTAVVGYRMNRDDKIRRHVIMRLACQNRVNWRELEARFDINSELYFAREFPRLETMAHDGLLSISQSGISVTDTGRLLLRAICMVFDTHRRNSEGRFSRVI